MLSGLSFRLSVIALVGIILLIGIVQEEPIMLMTLP